MREQCLVCGDPLINTTRGRKRVYCSMTCRRKRERVLARLRRNLGRLEARKERYGSSRFTGEGGLDLQKEIG